MHTFGVFYTTYEPSPSMNTIEWSGLLRTFANSIARPTPTAISRIDISAMDLHSPYYLVARVVPNSRIAIPTTSNLLRTLAEFLFVFRNQGSSIAVPPTSTYIKGKHHNQSLVLWHNIATGSRAGKKSAISICCGGWAIVELYFYVSPE